MLEAQNKKQRMMVRENTILITGGTGFAGTHLVEALLAQGTAVEDIHVTTSRKRPHFLDQYLTPEQIHEVDLTQTEDVQKLFQALSPAFIYGLASFSAPGLSFDKAQAVLDNNIRIQMNVLEALRTEVPEATLLSIGSAAEYAESPDPLSETSPLGPRNPYAVSKATQDMLASAYHASHNLKIVRVRPFNHIGERQEKGFVVTDFVSQMTQLVEKGLQNEIHVGNTNATRDFTDVKDMVIAYILLMEQGVPGEVYNVGSGRDITIQELLEKLQAFSTVPFTITSDSDKHRSGDVSRSVADISKIQSLGWEPTIPLDTTLQRIVQWWRQQ